MPPPGAPPADSLRAALDSVFASPRYDWAPRPDVAGWLRRQLFRLAEWLEGLKAGHPAAYSWLITGLVLVLVAIFVHAAWVFVRTVGAAVAPAEPSLGPKALRRDGAWYARAAEALAREGRFVDALQASFLALVMRLDARGAVRYHPGKTPYEYARDAAIPAEQREVLHQLVLRLYAYAFAGTPCGPEQYFEWQRAAASWGGPGAAAS